eukprot:9403503-Pyramimonas_sp.AAC.1
MGAPGAGRDVPGADKGEGGGAQAQKAGTGEEADRVDPPRRAARGGHHEADGQHGQSGGDDVQVRRAGDGVPPDAGHQEDPRGADRGAGGGAGSVVL